MVSATRAVAGNLAMIVFDLQCGSQHVFEGWFDSDEAFRTQLNSKMLQCPLCGDHAISKRLSAPRLNFGSQAPAVESDSAGSLAKLPATDIAPLQRAWLAIAREIVANTDDVGDNFAREARRIHYGEVPERGIRGHASAEDAFALLDEGIAVIPLVLPEISKNTLQ